MGSGKVLFEGILQIWSRKPPDIIHPTLDSVTLESMHQHFRKVRDHMYTYLEGVPGRPDLEKFVKELQEDYHIAQTNFRTSVICFRFISFVLLVYLKIFFSRNLPLCVYLLACKFGVHCYSSKK